MSVRTRRRASPCLSLSSVASSILLVLVGAYIALNVGVIECSSASLAPANDIPGVKPSLRSSSAASSAASEPTALRALLASAAARLAPFRGERVPLMHYTLALTGHPPLVVNSDMTSDGNPDFGAFGLPASIQAPHFFVVDPHEGSDAPVAAIDSPFRAAVRAEDTIRDIFVSALLSSGKKREGLGSGQPVCKASPVTIPFACLASLRTISPDAFSADGKPKPAALGGPLVLDIGHTAGGYYGLLAGSVGVSALTIDTQPQCTMWARIAAAASGVSGLVDSFSAIPFDPSAVSRQSTLVSARVRTGCVGTLTTTPHPKRSDSRRFYESEITAAEDNNDGGRAVAERARKFVQTEGAPSLGDVGGGDRVDIPIASVDDILCAMYAGDFCESSAAVQIDSLPPPLIIIAKIDARGYEDNVLAGMENMLANEALRPRNLLIEVNKNHIAARLGLASAAKAAREKADVPGAAVTDDVLVSGYDLDDVNISDEDNAVLAKHLIKIMQTLLRQGYEVLVSDRGWWSARASEDAAVQPAGNRIAK